MERPERAGLTFMWVRCSVQDLSSLDDQQRFDGLLEKVSLSALDPTDDELLDQTVDIISGGTLSPACWSTCEEQS
jgi:hypothetical protein